MASLPTTRHDALGLLKTDPARCPVPHRWDAIGAQVCLPLFFYLPGSPHTRVQLVGCQEDSQSFWNLKYFRKVKFIKFK